MTKPADRGNHTGSERNSLLKDKARDQADVLLTFRPLFGTTVTHRFHRRGRIRRMTSLWFIWFRLVEATAFVNLETGGFQFNKLAVARPKTERKNGTFLPVANPAAGF